MKYLQVLREYFEFKKMDNGRFPIVLTRKSLKTEDKTSSTAFDRHYIYHPAWAMRVLKRINPKEHVDISSILSFSTMASAYFKIKYYDYRPADIQLSNLVSGRADLTNLPFENESIESLSCMHTIEHIGLGRYGDKIDPEGDRKAMSELKRVLKKGGSLLIVVPVGRKRVLFNSHRIYSYEQMLEEFKELELKEFAIVPDDTKEGIKLNVGGDFVNSQNYACGCFWFKKK
ncbi:MAG: DUF268 domain-containing protein [Candidatus Dojkabacteria bacterium]